jgi:hypothetical protein
VNDEERTVLIHEARVGVIKMLAASIVRCAPNEVRIEPYHEADDRLDCWIEGTHEIVASVERYDQDDNCGAQDIFGELLDEVRKKALRMHQSLEDALKAAASW